MLSFLSGSRTGGKVSARLADDEERKKGGEIIIAVVAGVVWNGAYDFHRCLSMRLHHVLLRFFSGGHVFSASRFRSGFAHGEKRAKHEKEQKQQQSEGEG